MATIYVDSNASGADDGTSFADAFTSIVSVENAALPTPPVVSVGDQVLVASDHSESLSASLVLGNADEDGDDWVDFISVNSSTEAYEPGASITNSANITLDNARVTGFTLTCSGAADLATDTNGGGLCVDCTLSCDRFLPSGYTEFHDVDLTGTNTAGVLRTVNRGMVWVGGSLTATGLSTGDALVYFGNNPGFVDFIGVDLSNASAEAFMDVGAQARGRRFRLIGCSLNAATTEAFTAVDGIAELELINCDDGTTTVAATNFRYEDRRGRCEYDSTRTRTGGATDGETAHSLRLTALANQTRKSLRSAKSSLYGVSVWVEPGDTNLRIYIAHDAVGSGASGALQDNECWAVYQGPSEADPATSQLSDINTRGEFGATPSDLTTDSSTWSGTEVGTEQRIDITIDPTEAGYAHVWLYLATGSSSDVSINFDPKLEVT